MINPWRLAARQLTAAAVVMATPALASAQTVYMRHAPEGSKVEVVVNAASAGTAVVDAEGEAKVPFTLPAGKADMDASIYVDACDKLHKVVIVDHERQAPPPSEGCDRREISGIYWVRPVNTIVVDVGGPTPSLLLVRGSYTPPKPVAEGEEENKPSRPLPKGLLMFAGSAWTNYADTADFSCGTATPCTPKSSGFTYNFGATLWLSRFVGFEGSYMRPHKVTASGGDTFKFDTTLDSDVWTLTGKLGAQAGPVRIYGEGGTNYHEATNTTHETIETANQTFQYKTKGWSWVFGGGLEGWIGAKQRVAIYGNAGVMRIKGKAESGGEAQIDDRLKYVAIGVKLRVTR